MKPTDKAPFGGVSECTIRNFDLSPDGARVLVLGPPDPAPPASRARATLFLNFFDELRRRTGR